MEDNKEMVRDKKNGSNNEAQEMVDEKPFHYKYARTNIVVDVVAFGILPENQPDNNELRVFVIRPKGEGDWWLPGGFWGYGNNANIETDEDEKNCTMEKAIMSSLSRVWEVKKVGFEESSTSEVGYTIKPNIDFIFQLDAMFMSNQNDLQSRVLSVPYMTLVSVKNAIPSIINSNYAQWMPVSKLIKRIKDDDFVSGEEKLACGYFDILKRGLMRLFQEMKIRPIGGSKDVVDEEVIDKYVNNEDRPNIDDYFMLKSEFKISELIHIYDVIYQTMGESLRYSYLLARLKGLVKEVRNQNQEEEEGIICKFDIEKYKYTNKFCYKHARANIAVDVVVFGVLPDKDELHVFVQREKEEDKWGLPGGFMHCGRSVINETQEEDDNWTLDSTIEKVLNMTWPIKTIHNDKILRSSVSYQIELKDGQKQDLLCQLGAMSNLNRDSRGKRVVSVPYMTLVRIEKDKMPSDLINGYVAQWMPLSELITDGDKPGKVELDHDHFDILKDGLQRLSQEVRTRPVGKDMLQEPFELIDLIHIYNLILKTMGASVERSNLRKLLMERGVIKEVNDEDSSGKSWGKYRFVDEKYEEYKKFLNFGFNQNQKKSKDNNNKKS